MNGKCPHCSSDKVVSVKDYCAAVDNENTRLIIKSIQPKFQFGLPIGVLGVVTFLSSIVIWNNDFYEETFWNSSPIIRINQNGGFGFSGLLGIMIIAGGGAGLAIWGFKKHKEAKEFAGSSESDRRYYESGCICKECRKAWIIGFEENHRLL